MIHGVEGGGAGGRPDMHDGRPRRVVRFLPRCPAAGALDRAEGIAPGESRR